MRITVLLLLALLCRLAATGEGSVPRPDLADLSQEELLDVEVCAVSRTRECLADAAAAASVVTRDDLRRSGVTSLPDALHLVPGMEVARIDAHKWAVAVRGSSSRFANRLRVLVDGRAVYTPIYSGVYWDMRDICLEDVERIEVIRGPGASPRTASAVNGIVNIIAAPAVDTQGPALAVAGGTEERAPSRGARDVEVRVGSGAFLQVLPLDPGQAAVAVSGDEAIRPEDLLALELGYRALPGP
ncbi:MAG: TonB-dependent receptor plug domain-containing protein [Gemmatimonadota bacterium]